MKILALSLILASFTSYAGTVTRREFVRDGVTYIEETNIGNNGNISKSTFPKPGQDKTRLDTEMKAAEAEAKPVPHTRGTAAGTRGGGTTRGGGITRGQAAQLSQAIVACKPFTTSAAHPLLSGFRIEYQVHGMKHGKCMFTQTLPGGELQTCYVTEAQRQELQKEGATALQKWMGDPKLCPISKK